MASLDSSAVKKGTDALQVLFMAVIAVLLLQVLYSVCREAYIIRMKAIEEFGRIIHEFDPYFNYRATVYLHEHGWKAFRTWFDYMVWYPLGRPVGTTIYPGMQVTAVAIKNYILPSWSINDICCLIPAWFGVTATLSLGWLTYECTRGDSFKSIFGAIPIVRDVHRMVVVPIVNLLLVLLEKVTFSSWGLRPHAPSPLTPWICAVSASAIMSVIPAHLMRSIAGGYDNESIAVTAMALTFACWTASLRDHMSQWYTVVAGAVTGLAYFYMVAAWGGYVFVINMICLHAGSLVLIGRYTTKLHRAYTMFYLVGTFLAIQVPVVGWTPLKSLEQMAPLAGFLGLQLLEVCEIIKRRRKLNAVDTWKVRFAVFAVTAAAGALVVMALYPTGYFGPISSRVRGLFVKHTKTGNPLVDSVAEHQPASQEAYAQYLMEALRLLPYGIAMTALFFFNDSSSFLLVYAAASFFFSHRMNRLILLTAPITSSLGGVAIGRFVSWGLNGLFVDPASTFKVLFSSDTESDSKAKKPEKPQEDKSKDAKADNVGDDDEPTDDDKGKKVRFQKNGPADKKKNKKKPGKTGQKDSKGGDDDDGLDDVIEAKDASKEDMLPLKENFVVRVIRLASIAAALYYAYPKGKDFLSRAHQIAQAMSHPTIVTKARTNDGREVLVDDYREAYHWLRDFTPPDARIMAWWDYGYQITGIGNRTTIADGNTWNHEHIALLGRILTSPEKDAHRIARHLADYVLVWAGGGGDDVAKSPHLRRIANSVYRGLCNEPTCRDFGFYRSRETPTKSMGESLLYKLTSNAVIPGVEVDNNRFKEVFRSKYGKVRIYKILSVSQESKDWVDNPANRVCDAPGSWFCRGQYPPALKKILKEKKDFKQLEDFNVKDKGDDEEYQRQYFENLLGDKKGPEPEGKEKEKRKVKRLSPEEVDMINEEWENNEATSLMYELITQNQFDELKSILIDNQRLAHIRSEDGRGPMFWAHEHGRKKIVEMLKKLGVSETRTDSNGMTPLDVSKLK